jgi:hypothetical protein
MLANSKHWSIVVVGFWNQRIFTPQWVANDIFQQPEVEVLVSVVPCKPIIFRNQMVELRVESERIELIARRADDEALNQAETFACRVLEKLSITPVSAVGVNFGFVEAHPEDEVLRLLNFGDDADIAAAGWDIGLKDLRRTLRRDGLELRTAYSLSNGTLNIDMNFHYVSGSADVALQQIRGSAIDRKKDALSLLADTLHLKLDSE